MGKNNFEMELEDNCEKFIKDKKNGTKLSDFFNFAEKESYKKHFELENNKQKEIHNE